MASENITLPFNIANDYLTFIKSLRSNLGKSESHDIAVLMPDTQPFWWLDIQLTTDNHTITIRFDQRTLYLLGYSRDNGANFWEFSDSKLISGSKSLKYSGGYAKADGVERTAGVARVDLPLGYYALDSAIKFLEKTADPNLNASTVQESAKWLLLFTQIFAEATRIDTIAQLVQDNYFQKDGVKITLAMKTLENRWRFFSRSVLNADSPTWIPSTPLPSVPNPNTSNIWTVGQAKAVFGILKWFIVGVGQAQVDDVAVVSSAASVAASMVRTLVNILYVRLSNIGSTSPGKIYGSVTVEDCWDVQTAYNLSSANSETRSTGQNATLTGPPSAISGDGVVVMTINMLNQGNEIANGEIVWEPRSEDLDFANYDKALEAVVSGRSGSVTVGYSVIREALSATVGVVMVNGGQPSPAEVYGTIEVSQVLQKGTSTSTTTMTLFNRTSSEFVQVRPGESVPMTRAPVVAAQVNSPIRVTVNLWNRNSQIAQGSRDIPVVLGSTPNIWNITGTSGQILQVSTTFN